MSGKCRFADVIVASKVRFRLPQRPLAPIGSNAGPCPHCCLFRAEIGRSLALASKIADSGSRARMRARAD